MRALGKHRDGMQELGDFAVTHAVAEHRKAKRRLGDEDIAWNQFERCAGRIGGVLVVARCDDLQPLAFDRDLRRAKHVASRMERHLRAAQRQCFARLRHLRRTGEIRPVAEPHHVERFRRRQHRTVAGPRVVGMAVGDHGLVDRPRRVDMEAAGLAAHAGRRGVRSSSGRMTAKYGFVSKVRETINCHRRRLTQRSRLEEHCALLIGMARTSPAMTAKSHDNPTLCLIRRPGCRPALSVGAGLPAARRCCRCGGHPSAGRGNRAGFCDRVVCAGFDPRGDRRPCRRCRGVHGGARCRS